MLTEKFVQIDEEGYLKFDDIRVTDSEVGCELLNNLHIGETGCLLTKLDEQISIVEAFDEPYIAEQVFVENNQWQVLMPYGFEQGFALNSLSLDEWDRFHGYAENGMPFVFSRKAQAEFFRLLEDYNDDSITYNGERIEVKNYWQPKNEVESESFWSNIYRTEEPRWDLGEPAPALVDLLPRLKLPRCRVAVLGAGGGHDGAYFASKGHFVTLVDISPEAIDRAIKNYGHLENINFVEADAFSLVKNYSKSFDVVFEHTFFCAVNPSKRNEVVKLWRQLLTDQGHLMAILFAMEKKSGPPFGGTEWEYRERLKKNFRFLVWQRFRKSIQRRNGKELLIYAQKM